MGARSILVPVDFSPASRAALEWAIELARALPARLHVAHAVETLSYRGVPYEEMLGGESFARQHSEAREKLEEWLDIAKAAGVEGDVHVVDGDARDAILRTVEKLEVDLLVIGSRGHSRLHDLVVGSVAQEVVRRAPCSVLLVR